MNISDGRLRVVVVDRAGFDRYRLPDGAPALDPAKYRVTLLTRPQVAAQAGPAECAEVFALDIDEEDLTAALITAVHEAHGVDRVVVFPENLLVPIAAVRERLGIAGPRVAAVEPFRDKPTMKRTAQRAGIPVVEWIAVESATQLRSFHARHGAIVAKPRDGAGSANVSLIHDEDDLRKFLENNEITAFQAEQLVDDTGMVHVDAVVRGGEPMVSVMSQYLSSTLSHVSFRPLMSVTVDEPGLLAAGTDLLADVIKAFSVQDAVLHLEAFVRPDGRLVFNEVACRAGGAGVVPLVQAVEGVNLFEAMVRMALDEEPTTSYAKTAKAAGWVLLYGGPGVLDSVADDEIPAEWIVERKIAVRPGDFFTPVGRAGGGLVSYVVRGTSREQVEKRLRTIVDRVEIRYRDTE